MGTKVSSRRRASRAISLACSILLSTVSKGQAVPPDEFLVEKSRPEPVLDAEPIADFGTVTPATTSFLAGEFENTGGDTCADTVVIDVPVGPPGSPMGVMISGDTGAATGPDCDGSIVTSWWEAFRIDTCATVTIHFCDSPPRPSGTQARLIRECGPGGAPCGSSLFASAISSTMCGATGKGGLAVNDWVQFTQIPAGTYYYPVRAADTPMPEGSPYVLTIEAETCTGDCDDCFSACCDAANRTCQDSQTPTECSGPGQEWHFRRKCCQLECRPMDEEFDSQNVELMSHVAIEDFSAPAHSVNEMWGYTSPSGREYAILGFTTGTGFIEVTDPQIPSIIEEIQGGVDVVWRDMDVIGHHAYIVSDGSGVGLQIVDLSAIDDGVVTLVKTTDLGVGFTTAHNIRANPRTKYLYPAIPNAPDPNGITAIDARDPLNPVITGAWTDATANVRCHDVHVVSYTTGPYAGREIAFCFAEDDGVKIVDVTDKSNMFTMSTLEYGQAYTHQGWLSGDRRYLFIDDELDERRGFVPQTTTYVGDVQDLANPVLLPSFSSGVCAIDHNLTARGRYVFEANYSSGLQVFDVSDIQNVQRVGFFDSHPGHNGNDFDGAWGVFVLPSGTILLSDRQRGLFVLRLSQDILPPGDCDADGDVDLRDFARIQRCPPQSTGPIAPLCRCADLANDNDIQLSDFAGFPPNMNGLIP